MNSFITLWHHIECILLKAASVPLGKVVSLAAEWFLSFYPQSTGMRLPEFLQFLTLNNWFFVSTYCASTLLPAHTQVDDVIGPITVIYVRHAFKSSAAAIHLDRKCQGSIPPPPFCLLSGSTLSEQPRIVWNGALIGLSYFHTGEYKRARKGLHTVALFDSLFSPPQSPSWPSVIFFFFFFFHATGWSLNPNLLCSTWKETGYRSFGFSSPSNSWQINSLPHPNTKPPPCYTIGRSYCCIWNTVVL